MKSGIRTSGIAILWSIFWITAVLNTHSPLSAGTAYNQYTGDDQYHTSASGSLFYHTLPSQGPLNNFNQLPSSQSKIKFNFKGSINLTIDKLIESKVCHRLKLGEALLIRLRKSEIIFPFHYFW